MADRDFVVKNGLVVNTNLLVANGDSNRIGINVASPGATLDVNGTANVSGNTIIGGNLQVTSTTITVGNSSSNATINSTSYSGTSNNASNLNGQAASFYTNATNLSTGTVPSARLGSGTANSTTYLAGDQTWKTISVSGTGTVTSVATANGLTGGTITTSGTLSVVGSNGISVTTSGVNVLSGSGIVSNTTGVHVNSAFISTLTGTLTANNSTNLNGQPASFYTNATNLSTGTVPSARLGSGTANSTTYLAGDQTWKTIAGGGTGTVTSVGSGNGLTGGPITTSGTLTVLGANGISVASTGVRVTAANGISVTTAGVNVLAGTGVTSNATGVHIGQAVSTTSSVQFGSLGVGTAASGTSGEIRATNNITAYYSSDKSLKTNIKEIADALSKVNQIRGVEFDWTDEYIQQNGGEHPYFMRKHDVGVIAQEIESVLPEVVATREGGIKAVKYDRIVALLIEAVKELSAEVESLKKANK